MAKHGALVRNLALSVPQKALSLNSWKIVEISKTQCFYEIIRQGRPCKAYFDLGADAGIMTEEQGWIMCKAVIQLWNDRIKRRWPEAVMECAQCLAYMVLNGSRMTR
jgi:hypothetical protein